jgi:hypothetical protein
VLSSEDDPAKKLLKFKKLELHDEVSVLAFITTR